MTFAVPGPFRARRWMWPPRETPKLPALPTRQPKLVLQLSKWQETRPSRGTSVARPPTTARLTRRATKPTRSVQKPAASRFATPRGWRLVGRCLRGFGASRPGGGLYALREGGILGSRRGGQCRGGGTGSGSSPSRGADLCGYIGALRHWRRAGCVRACR